jgi:hypothetical protein
MVNSPLGINFQKRASTFFHPDFTVGPGFSPDQPQKARGLGTSGHTAGTELHPSLKVLPYKLIKNNYMAGRKGCQLF